MITKNNRKLEGKVVIATHNDGKLREMRELLAPFGVAAVSAKELGLPVPPETGFMFSQNASLKAKAAADASGLPALSDDSGLCIDALDGAPGLFSADWAGEPRDFEKAMQLVQKELQKRGHNLGQEPGTHSRAHFVSALVIHWPDSFEELFEGRVFGDVVWPPRGTKGFGYDPMFLPDGETRTFGQLSNEEKHGINWNSKTPTGLSHRARAFLALAKDCLHSR